MNLSKYNQFIQRRMKEEQPDLEKLVNLGSLLRRNFDLVVHREPILLFKPDTFEFVKTAVWINEEEYKAHVIHCPDILFYVRNHMWIFEVDGYIHNVKDSVAWRDIRREEHYTAAKLNFEIFNEFDILVKLGHKPNRAATVDEIWTEMKPRVEKILASHQ